MTDKRITELTPITGANLADDDEFVVVDISADETKSITYGELKTFSDLNLDTLGLNAIAESKGVTAVDVFVYDTSKDSDGGAWRKRMQNRSWYATNGDFPSATVILATASSVIIYSADDATLPTWTTEDYTGLTITSVDALNGKIVIGTTTGLIVSDYALDNLGSTTLDYTTSTSPAIVNNSINDVAMTVLSGAPIDAATGLAIPTIAVATGGGVSVINNDGTVADSTQTVGMLKVWFGDNDRLFYSDDASDQVYYTDTYATDGFNAGGTHYDADAAPYTLATNVVDIAGNTLAHTSGITILDEDQSTQANGMVAYVTSDYNTGWMVGDIKGAFLSSTDTSSLVGGTDDDRSVNNNPLTVNGTITRTSVATGTDLVAYSGFTNSNYLRQAYNSDLDFGTGDFCISGWTKGGSNNQVLLARQNPVVPVNNFNRYGIFNFGGNLCGFIAGDSPEGTAVSIIGSIPTDWSHFIFLRRSGVMETYRNGVLNVSSANTSNLTNVNAVLTVGNGAPLNAPWAGSATMIRVSATAPTAAQIKKAYEDEKYLFQENAKAVLTNSTVEALAFDTDTKLLHVGGNVGRDEFQGLRRTATTAGPVTSAISAQNNLVATGKASTVDVFQPAISLRELLNVLRSNV